MEPNKEKMVNPSNDSILFLNLEGKESKLIYYLINLLLMLIFTIRYFSLRGLLGLVIGSAIVFYLILMKTEARRNAASYLGAIIFWDVCVGLVIFSEILQENLQLQNLLTTWSQLNIQTIIWICIGFVLAFISFQKDNFYWLSWIGAEIVGIAIIMQLWTDGNLFSPVFREGGEEILVLFMTGAGVWFLLSQLAIINDEYEKSINTRLGFVLLIASLFLLITEKDYIDIMIPEVIEFYRSIADKLLPWWKVIFYFVILIIIAFYLNSLKQVLDSMVCYVVATGILLAKILMINYFCYNWLLFCVFAVISLRYIKHLEEDREGDTGDVSIDTPIIDIYIILQPIIGITVIMLFKWGLWMNVIFTILLGLLFYDYYMKKKDITIKYDRNFWILILVGIAAEAMAWIWTLHFHIEKIVMVAIALFMAMCTMLVVNWKHPSKVWAPLRDKIAICILLGIICLFSVNKFGSKIKTGLDEEKQTITIEVEAKGKENQIDSVTCVWTDSFGKQVGEKITFKSEEKILSIQAEKLTIKSIDQNGVETVKFRWFPKWKIEK